MNDCAAAGWVTEDGKAHVKAALSLIEERGEPTLEAQKLSLLSSSIGRANEVD